MRMTPEAIELYVQEGGRYCPYCRSEKLAAGELVMQKYGEAFQDVSCLSCKGTWTDEFVLKGITAND